MWITYAGKPQAHLHVSFLVHARPALPDPVGRNAGSKELRAHLETSRVVAIQGRPWMAWTECMAESWRSHLSRFGGILPPDRSGQKLIIGLGPCLTNRIRCENQSSCQNEQHKYCHNTAQLASPDLKLLSPRSQLSSDNERDGHQNGANANQCDHICHKIGKSH